MGRLRESDLVLGRGIKKNKNASKKQTIYMSGGGLRKRPRGTQAVVALTLLDLAKMFNIPRERTEYTTYTTEAPAEGVSERLAALGEECLRWQVHVCTYPDTAAACFAARGEDGEAFEHSAGGTPMWDTVMLREMQASGLHLL